MTANPTLTDLDRTRIALHRLYTRWAEKGAAAEAAEQEGLNGEATLSGGNLCMASSEDEETNGNDNPSTTGT